ncbi:hypothetical protein QCA50_003210 [Cerrena zonata]|uniref:Uncharacterized protein n=1 Tax=Cerrena zonata TaxID=2478898 RepID=A0AAW0GLN2_9APHY
MDQECVPSLAAVLFSFGFGLFSLEIASTPDEITEPSTSSFRKLSVYFALASFGTVLSYASSSLCARTIEVLKTAQGISLSYSQQPRLFPTIWV